MSQIDKRIKVNTIIENQLPEFISADFPNAVEFFKQYYISQEFQGGTTDLISNFDQYLKVDNLVPEVIVGLTSITSSIESTDTTINVPSTKGFPSEYGLLKIDNEIISYTGITSTSFTGCIRGFSGVTGYNVGVSSSLIDVNKESLKFEETTASSHTNGSSLQNLSVLFLQEFYRKLKKTFLPGFENTTLTSDLDVGNFVKFARSFYQSKGIEESIRVLFKVLYGVESRILDLESNLIKPSDAEYIRREVIICDLISDGDPSNLVGQTIYKSDDLETNASISEVEIFNRDGKNYYRLALFVGYNDRDLIKGIFSINPYSKVLSGVSTTDSVISVDSTVGFGATGTLKSGTNTIEYKSKTINQFFGCTGIDIAINTSDNIRKDEFVFGYENGDITKKVELRVTGVLTQLVTDTNTSQVTEGERIFVKNVGEKILNQSLTYKQKFANSWIYNTSSRFQVDVTQNVDENGEPTGGGSLKLKTKIDKSSIKKNDLFQILRRNEQVIDGSFIVESIVEDQNQITTNSLGFTPVFGEEYDIRRVIKKASSTGTEIREGNDNIISNVLNVYVDSSTDGYVASNSLPSYTITDKVINETIIGIAQTTVNFAFDGKDEITDLYNYLSFSFDTNRDIKFIQGDAVVYSSIKDPNSANSNPREVIPGLNDGQLYYVDPQLESPGTNTNRIALYLSRAQIGTASTVPIGIGVSSKDQHVFTLQKHHGKKISANKILRKFPLDQNLFNLTNNDENITDIGILKNGVELRSPVSEDVINYGGLTEIDVINGGSNYDIINPPKIIVETSTGNQAQAEPILSGSVEKILIDPQDFDIESVKNISLTGGNGNGCVLETVLGERSRELRFDSRDIFFGGGIDIDNETITFQQKHNLENGELVYYLNNGNPSLGIGAAYDGTNTITGTLATGDPYYARVVNPQTIRIYNKLNDALSGINTVGLSTDTAASGIHIFRTISKNTIIDIKVLEPGEGYQYRKLIVKPSGISTSFDTVNFVNHGFKHGDLINYSPMVGIGSTMPKEIQGLSTTSSYYVMKVDDDSFKLANAGVGGTSIIDFERGKVVGLNSTGTGYQIFKYPDIKVNLEVGYAGTVTGDFTITPHVKGSFTGAYVYESGSEYGSTILNNVAKPSISIEGGKYAELRPVVSNGRIVEVVVVDQGENYFSNPEIEITSSDNSGSGAIVRSIVEDGKLIGTVVVNSGIGYSESTTNVTATTNGINGAFDPTVRGLQINEQVRSGDSALVSRGDFLSFNIIGCDQELVTNLEKDNFDVLSNGDFDKPTNHSSIIGWAYDGNPIYGPFGYTDPNSINSTLKLISSSYVKKISDVTNRPSGFEAGYFIDDFVYDASGDLDIHNGRFCKTPEFPNGVYAYFATAEVDPNGKLIGSYPFFVGKTFRLPLIEDNLKLDHDFDFNSSGLSRNTYPYNVSEEFANYDFIIESNESINSAAEVTSVSKGEVESISILNPGTGYKVGDIASFDNTDSNGTGLNAEVSDIVGLGISTIETNLSLFENLVFTWDKTQVNAKYLPFVELNEKDNIFVSGLNKSIQGLTDSFKIGITTSRVALIAPTKSVTTGNVAVEDIFVNKIPNDVSIGGTIRVGSGNTSEFQSGTIDETMQVINIFPAEKIIRVVRNTGVAHTYGSNVDILNSVISLPLKTKLFESQLNDVVYFNAPQQIGIGTSGGAVQTSYFVGETIKSISIPNRQIYLPNHPFVTGQKVKLNVPNAANKQLNVATTDDPNDTNGNFSIPFLNTDNSIDLFVIKKSNNYIGLSTVSIGSSSEGLYFKTNASNISGINTHLYNITSQFEQVTGDIEKVTSIVTTKVSAANTTTHKLQNGDVVTINVVPNLSVGINTTNPVQVDYNSEYEKLIINPRKFESADVETNRIDIQNHGFETGDKVFYTGDGSGIENGSYFVYKISSRYFQLAETYSDLYSDPIKLINISPNTGGNNQSISPINPQIKVYKNSKLTFGLSTTNLADFDFKIFYENGENEYLSSLDSTIFNVQQQGTIGLGTDLNDLVGATLSLQPTTSTPPVLYYGLTKGGFISTADTDVQNYSQICFVDSIYNGDYKIFDITDDKFSFSPKAPEFLNYNELNCEVIEYSTKSTNVIGGIKDLKLLSKGFNYKKTPIFKEVISDKGTNANLTVNSRNIGQIKNIRMLNIGYEYTSDKTLQPEILIPPIINIDNLDQITDVEVVNGGTDYTTPPSLIVFNPSSNTIVDDLSLDPKVPGQTISSVDIIASINGLDSVEHKIFAVNNSNGIGINSIQSSSGGLVTCFMETPFNGFLDPQPFKVGDEIYVEGIQRIGEPGLSGLSTGTTGGASSGEVLGDGFNSSDHNFQFFKVVSYTPGTTTIVKYSVAGVTTNPGIAKSFQSGYASIINKENYPEIRPIQTRGVFQQNEILTLNGEESGLTISEIRDDYVKLNGVDYIKNGDRITGKVTGVSAEIASIKNNLAKFEYDFSSRQDIGWNDDIGKLNDDTQVIPNNDYYQNLSYSVKSSIPWETFSNSLNSIIHPAGLKNFSDTFIETKTKVGIGTTLSSIEVLILDLISDDNRVDAINNFDNALDFNRLGNKSKTLLLSEKKLTNFNKCITNRVLIHDDVSDEFSSVGFANNSTTLNEINGKFVHYLVQIVDPDSFDTQLSELVVLATEDDVLLVEKSTDSAGVGDGNVDGNSVLGTFDTEMKSDGTKNLLFNPIEKFEKDHDIKIIKTFYDIDALGITTSSIGSIQLVSANVGIESSIIGTGFVTTTVAEFNKDQFNGLHATIFVQDSLSKEINYNEIIVDFDGVDTTTSQIYIDDKGSTTTNTVGVVTTRMENNIIKLQIENDRVATLDAKANIVGFGTTTAGIGTFRFLTTGQPPGNERSARFESTFNVGTGTSISYANLDRTTDGSIKSLIKVSTGQTSAIHQVVAIRDASDVMVVQYPYVSLGSTSGIGSFISDTNGDNISLLFVPDAEFTDEVTVQSYNQILYTESDFNNLAGSLKYGAVETEVLLSTYDGLAGRRANKTKFELEFEGTPIYSKTFNPDGVGLEKSTGIFTIPNHFYNTNEELSYEPTSTFIGIAATAVSIGATINSAGITTDILPSTVFAKVISENKFQLFPTKEDVTSGVAITFTGIGAGNAHKLDMSKKLSKTIIGLDGVVQQPITFTDLNYTLDVNIGVATTQFPLSGISSISTFDVLKIDNEYMKIIEVGFSSTSDGSGQIDDQLNVSLGISTIPTVRVQRGVLGIAATSHTNGDTVRVHRGSFNIVDSSIHFIDPPKGNTRSRRTDSEIPFVKANFSGRTFLRQDYTTNMLFDDISDTFTGLTTSYDLKVGGAHTSAGIGIGNGVVFINGVFQTPDTTNNTGNPNNYGILADTVAGVSTIRFTGITSENGQFIVSDSDINQNQIPRGGLIVSLGSTEGIGYAPLNGAKVRAEKNSNGELTGIVGIGTSSGFSIGIQTADYNKNTGIITVTTNDVHGFGLDRPTSVKLKNLEFSCVGYSGVTTTIFQDHERPLFLVGIVSERSFEVQAGPSTIVHTYEGGGHAFEFFEDLTFGSGYRGGSVAIGVTDIAYEHRFVSSGIGSIKKTAFSGASSQGFTATDALYESHSGLLTLTIPNHTFTTSDTVGIDTGGIVFKCSKDGFIGNHPYPRTVSKTSFPNSDPFAGSFVSIGSTSLSTVTFNVGAGGGGGSGAVVTATVGVGGSLAFNITNPGSGYVNPELMIPEPVYENLEVVGVSRLGVGATTDTGSNLLLNVGVSAASTTVGIGSTTFQIKDFEIARAGHSFKKGDKFKPVGLVTAAHLSAPIQEFELEVLEIFNDKFSAWQFGEIDAIDSIKILQDGRRTRFPLFFNGELVSFEKVLDDPRSALIDLDAVLLIFINGVLQKPGEAYQFQGGTTFSFTEPPSGESGAGLNDNDKVDIFFYKGIDGVDVKLQTVTESIKIGDNLRVFANQNLLGITTSQQSERIVKEILNTDILDTDIYTGLGIDEKNEKPIRWTKQKTDFIINGQVIDKSRSILEPQIYPTSKIIGDLSVTSGKGVGNYDGIFVDDAIPFFYENKYPNFTVDSVDALITSGDVNKIPATAEAVISGVGTQKYVSSLNITEQGSGYEGVVNVRIAAPPSGIGVGVGTTATATLTVSNGQITGHTVTNIGLGYSSVTPPDVIIDLPKFKTEKLTGISDFQGYTGIITGITQITRSGGGPALRFDYHAYVKNLDGTYSDLIPANPLLQGYPVLITETKVGNGLTSVEPGNASVVGVGTTFVDNVYVVHSITTDGSKGTIVCHVHTNSASSISGINTQGFYDGDLSTAISLGRLSWGRLYGEKVARAGNPISIGVTGMTINSGLTTFPTIQRKSYDNLGERGHRSSGSIRAVIT